MTEREPAVSFKLQCQFRLHHIGFAHNNDAVSMVHVAIQRPSLRTYKRCSSLKAAILDRGNAIQGYGLRMPELHAESITNCRWNMTISPCLRNRMHQPLMPSHAKPRAAQPQSRCKHERFDCHFYVSKRPKVYHEDLTELANALSPEIRQGVDEGYGNSSARNYITHLTSRQRNLYSSFSVSARIDASLIQILVTADYVI